MPKNLRELYHLANWMDPGEWWERFIACGEHDAEKLNRFPGGGYYCSRCLTHYGSYARPTNPPTPPDVKRFRGVQPWGLDKAFQHTLQSEHRTAGEAFAETDRLAGEMVRTGAPSDAIELLVVTVDACRQHPRVATDPESIRIDHGGSGSGHRVFPTMGV